MFSRCPMCARCARVVVARMLFPHVLLHVVGTPGTYSFAARKVLTLADNAELTCTLRRGQRF
jgi:hypothetical protein